MLYNIMIQKKWMCLPLELHKNINAIEYNDTEKINVFAFRIA